MFVSPYQSHKQCDWQEMTRKLSGARKARILTARCPHVERIDFLHTDGVGLIAYPVCVRHCERRVGRYRRVTRGRPAAENCNSVPR